MTDWLLLAIGLGFLVAGAELLVRGASSLATRFGVSPLVVGLTVGAFGTSAPEIAVSLNAVAENKPDLALGNAVGSNIFNALFILGLTALITPIVVQQKLVRIEVPLIILAGLVLWAMLLDGMLGRLDGLILLTGIVAYTGFVVRSTLRGTPEIKAEHAETATRAGRPGLARSIGLIAAGLIIAVLGSRWLVDGAVSIAESLGISELVIGLTIVAAGTSLPELATSIVAAIRGQRDIAVGNVLGSNLFNILAILGLVGTFAPDGLPASPALMSFDLPIMIAVSIACLPIMFTGFRINRWEGAFFLLAYSGYIAYLILDAADHAALAGLTTGALWFALPLAGLGITLSVAHTLRGTRSTRLNSKHTDKADP